MRRIRISAFALFMICVLLLALTAPCSALAKEIQPLASDSKDEMFPPHLIQTVTEKDLYEGILALGFLESPILNKGDCEAAYENVKGCVVRLNMRYAYGSGVIWEMTPKQIIIATNKHVLDYWNEMSDYVSFQQGFYAAADALGVSEEYDIGFLAVDNDELSYEELIRLQYVHWDMRAYQKLQPEDDLFHVGAGNETTDDLLAFYQGSIGDMWRYIDEFSGYMIYGYGNAVPGMSGGGTFDAKGNFIGMISGGTTNGETASVPLPVLIEAYEKIR